MVGATEAGPYNPIPFLFALFRCCSVLWAAFPFPFRRSVRCPPFRALGPS